MKTRNYLVLPMAATAIMALLLTGGCQGPTTISGGVEGRARDVYATNPNFGPPMQDARTEAVIHQMEMDYNAAKNSRPTQQHVAEAAKQPPEPTATDATSNAEAEREAAAKKAEESK
jgi:hypothetical protein